MIIDLYYYLLLCTDSRKRQRLPFTDPRVCKLFILDCCPFDVLSGTVRLSFRHLVLLLLIINYIQYYSCLINDNFNLKRLELGECDRIHDLFHRNEYESSRHRDQYEYECEVYILYMYIS